MAIKMATPAAARIVANAKKSPFLLGSLLLGSVSLFVIASGAYELALAYGVKKEMASKNHALSREVAKAEHKASMINKDKDQDIEFYNQAISSYAKVNRISGLQIAKMESEYFGAIRLEIKYMALDRDALIGMMKAMSLLGHIVEADEKRMLLDVVPFSNEDAIKQLESERNRGN